jgi:hypothetical protein
VGGGGGEEEVVSYTQLWQNLVHIKHHNIQKKKRKKTLYIKLSNRIV